MANGVDLTVVIGAFGGMLAGFFAISKVMLNQASKDRDDDRKERIHLALAIEQMAKSTVRVAEATEKGAMEAEVRNGHLADQHREIVDSIAHVAEIAVQEDRKKTIEKARVEFLKKEIDK